jgi:hypothetical protein
MHFDFAYLAARLKEASSWSGAAASLLAVLHIAASADVINAVLGAIAAIGGVIAVLAPEKASS